MTTTNSAPAVSRDQNGDVHDNNDPAARPTRRIFTTEEKLALLSAYLRTNQSTVLVVSVIHLRTTRYEGKLCLTS
jgi:hypothetical protein